MSRGKYSSFLSIIPFTTNIQKIAGSALFFSHLLVMSVFMFTYPSHEKHYSTAVRCMHSDHLYTLCFLFRCCLIANAMHIFLAVAELWSLNTISITCANEFLTVITDQWTISILKSKFFETKLMISSNTDVNEMHLFGHTHHVSEMWSIYA